MIIKLAGLKHTPWQEHVASIESEALCDEEGWLDEIFEAMDEGGTASQSVAARRVATPMPNFRRHPNVVAASDESSIFDKEFDRMQTHARSILNGLGHGH